MPDFGDYASGDEPERYRDFDLSDPAVVAMLKRQMSPEQYADFKRRSRAVQLKALIPLMLVGGGMGVSALAGAGGAAGGAASVPGAVSGAPITAASQGAAFGAPTVAGSGFVGGLAAPSTAPAFGIGAANTGVWSGAAGAAPAAGTTAAGTAAGTTAAAAGGMSKTMMGISAAAGFLQNFLNSRSTKANEKQRAAAELALLQLAQAHDEMLTDKKIAADKATHDADLADRKAGRDAELAMIDPYARTRSQADTMVQLDKLGQKKAFNYDISGLPFGSMMPHNTGTIGYEPSAELKAWAATRGGDVRAGLPGATTGSPAAPPTSNTMPIGGDGSRTVTPAAGPLTTTMPTMPEPSFVGDDLVDAPVSNVPLDSRELRMSIESLLRDSPATSRPMARRRRTPVSMPMR